MEDQDDIIYILPSEYKLNIAQPLYDFILLSLPIKNTCDKVGKVCDASITGKIRKLTRKVNLPSSETKKQWRKHLDLKHGS